MVYIKMLRRLNSSSPGAVPWLGYGFLWSRLGKGDGATAISWSASDLTGTILEGNNIKIHIDSHDFIHFIGRTHISENTVENKKFTSEWAGLTGLTRSQCGRGSWAS